MQKCDLHHRAFFPWKRHRCIALIDVRLVSAPDVGRSPKVPRYAKLDMAKAGYYAATEQIVLGVEPEQFVGSPGCRRASIDTLDEAVKNDTNFGPQQSAAATKNSLSKFQCSGWAKQEIHIQQWLAARSYLET